ncbi:MAG TPA: HD domain-containing phosphohydrolase [Bdellovibrionales bacterium]|nr:HD domain-containing phosphohydrolase [Bdellovibrionales bacterium]
MVAIPIREFIASSKLAVDIFVQLSSGRFVQVGKAGEVVALERLLHYESKKVEQLYVKKSDYSAYVDQNLVIAGMTLTRSDLNARKKSAFIAQVANSVLQEIDTLGFSVPTYNHARAVSRVTIDFIESKPKFRDVLAAVNEVSNDLFAHSLGTSIVSVILGQALGWSQQSVLEKLALGGLLHDIGMKEINTELIHKTLAQMTFEERREYELHPQKGMELLKTIDVVPEDVLAIVHEHHENAIGQGFPRRLKNLRIHPLARVVGLADLFCDLTIKSPTSKHLRPISEAVLYVDQNYGQCYPRDLIAALYESLQVKPQKKTA